MPVKLSLCMIVKNEEACLGRCLESARPVVDEVVIVDTGSTDRTVEIARPYADVLLEFSWQNDFSTARNTGLDHASGDWILVLDADEALEPDSGKALRPLLDAADADGFIVTIRNLQPADSLVAYTDLRLTRLFRNRAEYRYQGAIHEQIRGSIEDTGGKILDSRLVILHYGYAQREVQGAVSRARRNMDLLQQAYAQAPGDPYLAYQIGVTCKAMGEAGEAEQWLEKTLEMDYQTLGKEILNELFMKLAQLALGKEDYSRAAKYAQASLECGPRNTLSQYTLALSYTYQGDFRRAYDVFTRLRQDPALSPSSLADLDEVIRYCKSRRGFS